MRFYQLSRQAGNNEIQFGDPVPVGSTSVTKASPTPGSGAAQSLLRWLGAATKKAIAGVEIFANYHARDLAHGRYEGNWDHPANLKVEVTRS